MPPTPGLGSALGRFPDFTGRAAVYAIRTYGGKGGAPREGRPYPNRLFSSALIRSLYRPRCPALLIGWDGFTIRCEVFDLQSVDRIRREVKGSAAINFIICFTV